MDLGAELNKLLGGASSAAVDAASAKAADLAAQQWQQLRPWAILAGIAAALVFFFFFVPRFRLPWDTPAA